MRDVCEYYSLAEAGFEPETNVYKKLCAIYYSCKDCVDSYNDAGIHLTAVKGKNDPQGLYICKEPDNDDGNYGRGEQGDLFGGIA